MITTGAIIALLLRIYIFPPMTTANDYRDISFAKPRNLHKLQNSQHNHHCNCSSITNKTSPELKVPNIIHYIWYYSPEIKLLRFRQFLSILSVHKIVNPEVIYFHTDREPSGTYWEHAKKIPNFKINYRNPPTQLFGKPIKPPRYHTSNSNVDRLKILMEYGGIYLDFDTLIIRPLDDLRKYDCTIGLEQEDKACGNIIICHKDAPFLTMWLNSFLDDYRTDNWAYNTGKVRGEISLSTIIPMPRKCVANEDTNTLNQTRCKTLVSAMLWQWKYQCKYWFWHIKLVAIHFIPCTAFSLHPPFTDQTLLI